LREEATRDFELMVRFQEAVPIDFGTGSKVPRRSPDAVAPGLRFGNTMLKAGPAESQHQEE
jgi:hypothetical protein